MRKGICKLPRDVVRRHILPKLNMSTVEKLRGSCKTGRYWTEKWKPYTLVLSSLGPPRVFDWYSEGGMKNQYYISSNMTEFYGPGEVVTKTVEEGDYDTMIQTIKLAMETDSMCIIQSGHSKSHRLLYAFPAKCRFQICKSILDNFEGHSFNANNGFDSMLKVDWRDLSGSDIEKLYHQVRVATDFFREQVKKRQMQRMGLPH